MSYAGELAGVALAVGLPQEAADAANFILGAGASASAAARSLAKAISGVGPDATLSDLAPTSEQLRGEIRRLRWNVKAYPRDPLTWCDLARAYASVGLLEKAAAAMRPALSLAPYDRFVVRSAARMLIHNDDPEGALRLLRHSELAGHDPWVIAAEVATSSLIDTPSRMAKTGLALLSSRRVSPFDLSELASAVGTLELEHGKRRSARKRFAFALREPTENAVAQVEWASTLDNAVRPPDQVLSLSLEAQAYRAFVDGNWHRAFEQATLWQNDQFFSKQPPLLASFVAMFCLRNNELAEAAIRSGLVANPDNELLLNNLVVVLAEENHLEEAERVLSTLVGVRSSHADWTAIARATASLVEYRSGRSEAGREGYKQAVGLLSQNKEQSQTAVALAYWAREEARAHGPLAAALVTQAAELNKSMRLRYIDEWLAALPENTNGSTGPVAN